MRRARNHFLHFARLDLATEFLKAKNGSDCAKANGIFLHSQYNPQLEAERFAQNVRADFVPQNIIVIEGALGYCAAELKKKFPDAKIGAIRFCKDFFAWNGAFDFVFDASDLTAADFSKNAENEISLSEKIFNALGEEGIFKTLFLEWPPSARAFKNETKCAWREIKSAMEKSRAILATREHFGKKWLKNKVKFFQRIKDITIFEKVDFPIFICASGPSLESAISLIKKMREKIFLVALSSSISVLLHEGIFPDICFSTDGGFWAKKHLASLAHVKKIPLALAVEGECDSVIFEKNEILPLCYDDDELSKKLFAALDIPFMQARRNGTVSGTALEFFLAHGEKEIFFAGLDLSNGKTFAHAQPNALETEAAQKDFRLQTKATRIARAALPSPSLEIYAAWFANFFWKGEQKVFRICGERKFKNSLGKIKDISPSEAESILKNCAQRNPRCSIRQANFEEAKNRNGTIKKTLEEFSKSEEWRRELFPSECILRDRAASDEERRKHSNAIFEKTEKFLKEIFGKLK